MGDATGPQVGRDYVFAEVELRTGAPDGATGVDEQGAALRRDEQNGVAFANVDGSDLENSGAGLRFGGKEGES